MLIMALIRNGHSRVYEYGYSKFKMAQEELEQHNQSQILDLAYAHRVATSSNEDWKKFVKSMTKHQNGDGKPSKKQMTKADHMKVINRLRGLK